MFSVSVVDHVRLSFAQVVQNYTVHAPAAERLATLGLKARLTVLGITRSRRKRKWAAENPASHEFQSSLVQPRARPSADTMKFLVSCGADLKVKDAFGNGRVRHRRIALRAREGRRAGLRSAVPEGRAVSL